MTDTNEIQDKRLAALDQLKQIMPGILYGYAQEELLPPFAARKLFYFFTVKNTNFAEN